MSENVILGDMPLPKNFKYIKTLEHGKPQHDPFDPFRLKHPGMPLSKRAKIFAPFDALRGFDFKIREAKEASLNYPCGLEPETIANSMDKNSMTEKISTG